MRPLHLSTELFHRAKAKSELYTAGLAFAHGDFNIHRCALLVGIEHARRDRLEHAETVDGIDALLQFVGVVRVSLPDAQLAADSALIDQLFPLDGDRAEGRRGARMQLKGHHRRVRLLVDYGVGNDLRIGHRWRCAGASGAALYSGRNRLY